MQHPGAEGVGSSAGQQLRGWVRALGARLRQHAAGALILALGIALGMSFALGTQPGGGGFAAEGPASSAIDSVVTPLAPALMRYASFPEAPMAAVDGAVPDTSSAPVNAPALTNATGAGAPAVVSGDLSRSQAIALVQGRYRARVVRSSEMRDKSGHRLYVFRLLSRGGKVWTVRIDAHTGAEVP